MNGAFINRENLEKIIPSVVKMMKLKSDENAGVRNDDKKDTNDEVEIENTALNRENGELKIQNETKIDEIEELKLKINKLENEMCALKL